MSGWVIGVMVEVSGEAAPLRHFFAIGHEDRAKAEWTAIDVPGSSLTTVNSVFQSIAMGIYAPSGGGGVATYTALVDQSRADPAGGLNMQVGAASFEYGTTVATSVGSLIVGSQLQGNVMGGSIGNDTFVGTKSAVMADTIYTGGGADAIFLSSGRTVSTLIELYAGNNTGNPIPVTPGKIEPSVAGSIVSANDTPQLGWWGQATGQVGGPASNASTNLGFGTGTSADMSTVANFAATSAARDSIDLSLSAFSGLLRSATPGSAPALGNAVFSNPLGPNGVVSVANADVLVLSSAQTFSGAAAVASALASNATAINFTVAQTNLVNHYLLAYQDTSGNARIPDLDIHSLGAFTRTNQVQTLAVSDMIQLVGTSLPSLTEANIHFVA